MPAAVHIVQDHSRDGEFRIELLASQDHRCGGTGHLGRIHDQDDGGFQMLGEHRSTVGSGNIETVEEAAGALDNVDSFDHSVVDKRRKNGVGTHEKGVEIACRLSRGPSQPGCVNVVGALLERTHRHPGPPEGEQQSQGDERFAGAPRQAGDQQARKCA